MKKRIQISRAWQTRMKQQEEKKRLQERAPLWNLVKEYSDIKTLALKVNVSAYTISKALKKGIGSLRTLKHIDNYFTSRLEKIEQKNEQQSDSLDGEKSTTELGV